MQIWFMEPFPCGDRRLPHHVFPPKHLTPDQLLAKTGVQYFKVDIDDTVAMKKRLSRVKTENSISATDMFTINESTPDIDDKLEELYEPVSKEENVVTMVTDGSCYFDVEPEEDEWVRIQVERGDLIVIPKGLSHRFTVTPKNYVQMQRFFQKAELRLPLEDDTYSDAILRERMLTNEDSEPTFNLRLIEAVKHSPCLYDQNDRQYRSSEFKLKVWNRLANVLGYEGDKNMLANRWKQLRDKYGKEKKKMKEMGEPPTWQYFKPLGFLDPHMVDRQKDTTRYTKENKLPPISDPTFAQSLINEVHLQSCLYDSRDPKYRHTDCRNMAWMLIINNLKYPGDINSISKQWKTLRDHYVRERRMISEGLREESAWELYSSMLWMAPYVADREKTSGRVMKRSRRESNGETLSDDGYVDETLGGFIAPRPKQPRAAPDVLLDGDSAFAASAVSDLRSLSEHARNTARMQIEHLLLQSGSRHPSHHHLS